jgi:uncharacterized protein
MSRTTEPLAVERRTDRSVAELADQLIRQIASLERCVVAFSGGVDSAVVAAAAVRGLGERATAVTGRSPSVSRYQLDVANRVAAELGIRHRIVATGELARPEYVANDSQRCFWCKQTLYQMLAELGREAAGAPVLSGTNADDLGDHRPGIEAGRRAGVATPLADLGIGKEAVRAIARRWGLSVAELPASPCLASRIAYGVEVTPERLQKVEAAEAHLRALGFSDARVRVHPGDLARIEVPRAELPQLFQAPHWEETASAFQRLGFRFVTLDMDGLRSGNLNQLVNLTLAGPSAAEGHVGNGGAATPRPQTPG